MDKTARREMRTLMHKHIGKQWGRSLRVLDVGSYDVKRMMRRLMPECGGTHSSGKPLWEYVGYDIVPGPNVDVVGKAENVLPFEQESIDLVMSISCFQYVENPFTLMEALARLLKRGGYAIICASHNERTGLISLPEELCPNKDTEFDCWRFKKYGMRAMLAQAGLEVIDTYYKGSNCFGVAKK